MLAEPVSLPADSGLRPGYPKTEEAVLQGASRLEECTCLKLNISLFCSEREGTDVPSPTTN